MSTTDPRLEAFRSDNNDVFHSIQHRHEIWRPDPFDVDSVHQEAREAYERLLLRAMTPPGLDSGRMLLLLGDSGCGKTHLIRAFRALTHNRGLGFVGYLQMTTAASNYGRYVLTNLIDSLDQPYNDPVDTSSGLMKLSNALLSRCGPVAPLIAAPETTDVEDIQRLVEDAADTLVAQPEFRHIDLDLLRAMLYLQRNDPRIRSRLLKYLRCEDLSERDRQVLGGMVPRVHDDDPQRMVEQLGRIMKALGHSLVLCVDQLEDFFNFDKVDEASAPFRRAMQTLCSLADRVPSSVIVLSCLHNFWASMSAQLSQSTVDRIEKDPPLRKLEVLRTAKEARDIVARRLAYLYDAEDAPFDEQDPTWPFPAAGFEKLANRRVRDILIECHRWREQVRRTGQLPKQFPLEGGVGPTTEDSKSLQSTQALDQQWNDLRVTCKGWLPEDDESLAELLAWAIRTSPEELDSGHQFKVEVSGDMLTVDVEPHGARLLVALCNRHPQGGGFGRQLKSAQDAAQGRTLVIVRNSEFPNSPTSRVTEQIGQILSAGGRRAVFGDSDFRTLLALRDFRHQHESRPEFATWLHSERPLTQLRALRDILDLDRLRPLPRQEHTTKPQVSLPQVEKRIERPTTTVIVEKKLPEPLKSSPLLIGKGDGLVGEPVHIDPSELTQHSAFLGGPGSGKTTLALSLIEQLLVQGVPALLIDRKGDLASYASESFWTEPLADKALEERRALMRERVEVALFTPGHPHGRPLPLSLVPEGLASLEPFDREQATRYSAEALAGMMNLRSAGQDQSLRVILRQAVDLLVQLVPEGEINLGKLTDFVYKRDPRLVNAVGRLDTKLFERLVRSLETLRLDSSTLMNTGGEKLDLDMLLGRGAHARPGRTRLSIISTRFLGDNTRILFWVSQLLIEAGRWIGRHPSPSLQAVVLFDEADLYLPAMRQPATKEPMENLLRRARSAGLGLMLATQTPGDLDYKCRDNIRNWFVGRVKERTSLEKMKPMLSEARVDFTARIPNQGTGEFHVMRAGQVEAVKAARAAMSTQQLSEDEILRLAARTRPQAPQAA